jgi:hypothetical protein
MSAKSMQKNIIFLTILPGGVAQWTSCPPQEQKIGFESRQGAGFLAKHSNADVYTYALFV